MRHIAGLIQGRRRILLDIVNHVDRLLVVNELQADFAIRLLRVPPRKVTIIPTIIHDRFFSRSKPSVNVDADFFFVCAGNILPRKNQIRLAKAAIKAGIRVVFVGNVMGGCQAYSDSFDELVESSHLLTWHRWLSIDELTLLLKNSSGIAIPSFQECQPASGLEAAAMGKPLLLADRKYAGQKYFKNSFLCEPSSIHSIALGLSAIRDNQSQYIPPTDLVDECRPSNIGMKLKHVLDSL